MSYWKDIKAINANSTCLEDQMRNLYYKHRLLMSKLDLIHYNDAASPEARELILEISDIEIKLYQLMQELNE
jgi:hypothetical protein